MPTPTPGRGAFPVASCCRAVFMLALIACLLAACGEADASLENVTRRGYMTVGLDASYPPFEAVGATGEVEGLDVDLARLVAANLRLGVEFRNISFDGLYDALAAGQVDAIISALPYDALRTEDASFSPPYFDDGLVWVVAAAGTDFTAANGVAVEMGSEAAALMAAIGDGTPIVQLMSEEDVLVAVAGGQVERGVVTRLSACLAASRADGITIGDALTQAPYVVAVRADRAALAEAVGAAVTDTIAGEDWQIARERWLGEACR